MTIESVTTPSVPLPSAPYTPCVRAGEWLVISGQLGIDPMTGALADGVEAQAAQALRNLAGICADAAVTLADVAKTTVFVTDLAAFGAVNAIYAEAFGAHRPARSTIQVAALPFGGAIEIEAWVYAPRR
ncbi:MAG: RidA family protein [Acidimicrobiia bacterium]